MDVPELSEGACHVWWASPGDARPALLDLLDDTERQRWSRFRQPADRGRYLAAHALARLLLGAYLDVPPAQVAFARACPRCGQAHGKPRLRTPAAGLELSISHSGDRVAVAVARGVPVGVDVEQVRPDRHDTAMVGLALSAPEQEALEALPPPARPAALLSYWVRKEALLKATGDGLGVAPDRLTVTPPDQPPALVSWTARPALRAQVHLTDLHPGPGHVACLAALGARLRVSEHRAQDLAEDL
jgi:4'-phosphopantetheinyl transferase